MSRFIFKKYPSIENIYRTETILGIKELGFDKMPFMCSLKVHGSNFTICTDGIDIESHKRTSPIMEDETFYNYIDVLSLYKKSIFDFHSYLKNTHFPEMNVLKLHGELFGGSYPHPEVKKSNTKAVQKGVFYCPHNDFFLFDISIDGIFLHKSFIDIAKKEFGFINITLFKGSFDECMNYPNVFPDPLHKEFGLPEIKDNICEGVIIEPEAPTFFPNGERVILKNKNDKFKEKSSERKEKKVNSNHLWSVKGAELCSISFLYITENRLRNILSHIGKVSNKDFGMIQGLLAKDAYDDFMKDVKDEFECLELNEQKLITKEISKNAANLIRKNFVNIIDQNF